MKATGHQLIYSGMWFGQYELQGTFFHGQSGGPVVDKNGVVHGLVNGTFEDGTLGSTRSLSDTQICRGGQG
jgi:hypothetical protein